MEFRTRIFPEPDLEFGDGHRHPDPRLGLQEAGPLQVHLGDVIRVGVVGTSKTVADTQSFLAAATVGFKGNTERHPNLHPDFPGMGNENPYRARFEIEDGATGTIPRAKLDRILKEPNHHRAVELAVDAVMDELRVLDEGGHRPDVAVIALSVALIDRVWGAKVDSRSTTEREDSGGSDAPDFHGLLKARAMGLSFATQIAWEDILDDRAKVSRKVKESRSRDIQSLADRTWNLMTTLYYKGSGRIPWRRSPREAEYTACYVGVSFYREVGGQQLFTSAAQMFDERGRGFILKGKRAQTESRGRHPYMTQEDARDLVKNVLAAYRAHHRTTPARVVVMKTSRFRDEEADGIFEALDAKGIEFRDLVWVQESYKVRVLRDGDYPAMRGTFVEIGKNGLLYTTGSIPYYGTYPGVYDPNPLLICPHSGGDSTVEQLAEEIFSLTKINWNSTQMNQRLPIPIRAARSVGAVLKHLSEGESVSSDYRRYL